MFELATYQLDRKAKLDDFPGMSIAIWQQRPENSGYARVRSENYPIS